MLFSLCFLRFFGLSFATSQNLGRNKRRTLTPSSKHSTKQAANTALRSRLRSGFNSTEPQGMTPSDGNTSKDGKRKLEVTVAARPSVSVSD